MLIVMNVEKAQIKITLVTAATLIVFLVGGAATLARWQEGVERRIVALEQSICPLRDELGELNKRVSDQDVQYAAIKSDLEWIKTAILRMEGGL